MSKLRTSTGEIIREKRKENGWTQAELAEKSQCSLKTISKIENDQNTSTSIFVKVLSALSLEIK